MVDKGNVNGENQKYYKTVNAALNDAVLLKRHNTELGKSALYNYNGKTFLRIYDDEFGIDVYNLPKELFNELIKTESIVKEDIEDSTKDQVETMLKTISIDLQTLSTKYKKLKKAYDECVNDEGAIKILKDVEKLHSLISNIVNIK